MNNLTTSPRLPKMTAVSRLSLIDAFWVFSEQTHMLNESDRLQQIKTGLSAELAVATGITFNLADGHLALLSNTSLATLKRRQLQHKSLDSVFSERLDRIAFICQQALKVFESREAVARWMSVPNAALGHSIPILLCVSEIGARQVRRVLLALEWGGAA